MDATDIDLNLDLDPNFEPQTRARSNTWPLRPNREVEAQNSPTQGEENASQGPDQHGSVKDPLGLTAKKSGSRRNAWGNLSYADLITKAIQSSSEKRLTLSQIYDWMVQNVPYFKDKGDSTSSAGWKNSIRHNLSLHNRFMRIQNEGSGKSSWWVLNPDAKPGKTPRRRAGSMETKSYEKKRGRVRKKVEALQATLENGGTLSPVGSEDYLDALSYGDFRSRASSNASSCGRLSPIHAVAEPDLHDNQVPPMSPIPWGTEVNNSPTLYPGDSYSDLVDSLVDGMKLSGQADPMKMDVVLRDPYLSGSNQASPYMKVDPPPSGIDNQFGHLPAPPPYPKPQQNQQSQLEFSQQQSFNNGLRLQCRPSPVHNGSATYSQSDIFGDNSHDNILIKQEPVHLKQESEGLSPVNISSPNTLSVNTQQPQLGSPDRSQQGSPSASPFTHLSPQPSHSPLTCQVSPQHNRHLTPQQQQQQQQPITTASLQLQQQQALQQASILREALTRGPPAYRSHSSTNTPSPTFSHMVNMSPLAVGSNNMNSPGMMPNGMSSLASHNSPLHHVMNQANMVGGMNNTFADNQMTNGNTINLNAHHPHPNNYNGSGVPSDIDMELISRMDYDMDLVIKQELSLEGNLDFNFDTGPTTSMGQNVVH